MSLFPEGYRDPPYDGTETGFGEVVLPARLEAITRTLNERFAGVLPDGMRFEYVSSKESQQSGAVAQ